jgi:hypothetical protein
MTNTQDATPSVATPVIYEGLEFPELPYVSRWVEVDGIRIHSIEGATQVPIPSYSFMESPHGHTFGAT